MISPPDMDERVENPTAAGAQPETLTAAVKPPVDIEPSCPADRVDDFTIVRELSAILRNVYGCAIVAEPGGESRR